jgi:hypothetical protein
LHQFAMLSFWYGVPLLMIAFLILCYIDDSWRVTEKDVARYLNRSYPPLEESSELLLKEPSALNLLEQLQVNKTREALEHVNQPPLFNRKIKISLINLASAVIICLLLSLFVNFQVGGNSPVPEKSNKALVKLPAGVSAANIRVAPPAYTRKRAYEQTGFDLHVEEGAAIHWEVSTNMPVKILQFIYNDSSVIDLRSVNNEHTVWQVDKLIAHPGFYQVRMDSAVSELYKIEIVKDLAPVITVLSPKPTTVIDYGEPARVNLQASVTDDYGVKDVSINATIAKGSGEGVRFKQQRLSFETSFSSQQLQYQLQKTIGLAALGMEPGDELYFYIMAIDNHNQEKRSDIFIVSITDTARLMSMDGLLNGVILNRIISGVSDRSSLMQNNY